MKYTKVPGCPLVAEWGIAHCNRYIRRIEAETGLQSQGREADLPRLEVFFLLTAERLPQLQRIESPRLIYQREDRKKRMKNTRRPATFRYDMMRKPECVGAMSATCLELERYLQTEPKRLSELFEDELDCLLSPDFTEEHVEDESLNQSLFSITSSPLHLDGEPLTSPSTPDHSDLNTGVDVAQLNALTSLTPPSSPELKRHSLKSTHTLCTTANGTLMLKLAVARPLSPGPSDGEQASGTAGTRDLADNKKRVFLPLGSPGAPHEKARLTHSTTSPRGNRTKLLLHGRNFYASHRRNPNAVLTRDLGQEIAVKPSDVANGGIYDSQFRNVCTGTVEDQTVPVATKDFNI
ncbi:Krueppel-like factor 7 [Bagarius yarrelli]|uniref:Krueppel-like factor 7 n=1 Tax=Bagarius yarrelli TaxID=175774 RepID=A0A556VLA6_BAGYA|nr:Krueppel-like factor 7 [Bagarius yarrelli]